MTWVVGQCLLLLSLFLGTYLTGLALLKLWGPPFLLRRRPEQQALYPIVGTGSWMLLFGLLSHLGLRAGPATAIVLALSLLLVVLSWKRHADLTRFHRRMTILALAAAFGAILSFLPIYLHGIYNFNNDAWAYMVVSDWLQGHGFGQLAEEDLYDPFVAQVRIWQHDYHRLGQSFLLALIQALCFVDRAFLVYPAVMAWAFMLLLFALYIFARWCLRLRSSTTTLLTILLAVSMNPVRWGATNGALSQIYGTGALLAAIALLARLVYRRTRSGGDVLILALLGAYLLSTYNEMFPVLGLVSLVFFFVGGAHAYRHHVLSRFMVHMALLLCLFLAFSNIEVLRAYHAVQIQMRMVGGWILPLTPWEYWSAAMGQHHYMIYPHINVPIPRPPESLWQTGATVLMSALFIIGLPIAHRRDRSRLLLVASVVMVALLLKFGLSPEPSTGYRFHTYVFFKVIQWSYPLIAVVQFAGLEAVSGGLFRLPPPAPFIATYLSRAIVVFLTVFWLPAHVREAKEASQALRNITESRDPYATLDQLALEIDRRKWDVLYLLPPVTNGGWPHLMYAYFLHPRPTGADWRGSQYVEKGFEQGHLPIPPKGSPLYLFLGNPYGCNVVERLPANVALIEERPCLLNASLPTSVDGSQGTSLNLFSPSKLRVRATVQLPSEFIKTLPIAGFRVINSPGQGVTNIPLSASPHIEMVLTLNAGITEITLVPLDSEYRPIADARLMYTPLVSGVRIEPMDAPEKQADKDG